ncbi:TPA: hypothetical protein DD425_01765 [Candidatus Saccharibacteria bacterium]|nr:hypothetical protein [Candidatus Saccharibacteria bacterium]
MAFTYIALNVVFVVCMLVLFLPRFKKPSITWWLTLGILLLLTAVFDSLIIWAGIVGYDTSKLLGIYIGFAPIEDFFYALLAVVLIPIFWKKFAPKKEGKE